MNLVKVLVGTETPHSPWQDESNLIATRRDEKPAALPVVVGLFATIPTSSADPTPAWFHRLSCQCNVSKLH